jgi:hypothetical protein
MSAPKRPLLLLVGGFLGAGKTTLLLKTAALLKERGLRVALITNDQGGALVDTQAAAAEGVDAEEIAGGCFCCRLSDFVSAAERLLPLGPDVILAEPVGSCIDLAATVLRPLQRDHAARFRVAPLTVLVDPERARRLLAPGADPSLAYLFLNQIEEADIVCFSHADRYSEFPELPVGYAHRLSGTTGEGVEGWLREALAGSGIPGARPLEVDYRRYADAEAALGWLNWQVTVDCPGGASPAQVAGPMLDEVDRELTESGVEIAHLKVFARAVTGYIKASVCRNGEEPRVQGALDASPARRHELLVNLRACGAPELLQSAVRRAAGSLPGKTMEERLECFRPAPPKPEVRIASPGPGAAP